jgi:hypothetical protein
MPRPNPGVAADQELARSGDAAEPCRDVDRVAERREIELVLRSEDADECRSGLEPDPDADASSREVGRLDLLEDLARGEDRSFGVVRAGDDRDEQRHDAVTEELVDDAAVPVDGAGSDAVEALEQAPELGGRRVLGDPGRATDVGEQDADLDFGAARHLCQRSEAQVAQQRTHARLPVHDDRGRELAGPMERRRADLAPRRRRDEPPPATDLPERIVLAGQDRPPLLGAPGLVVLLGRRLDVGFGHLEADGSPSNMTIRRRARMRA